MRGGGIAWAASGHYPATIAADKLTKILDAESVKDTQEAAKLAIRQAWTESFGSVTKPRDEIQGMGRLLVCESTQTSARAFSLDIYSDPMCEEITDKICTGDHKNPAAMLTERYFVQGRKVDELIFLAAVVVLTAGDLNGTYVGGLEITIGRRGDLRKLDAREIGRLRQRTISFHAATAKRLLGH